MEQIQESQQEWPDVDYSTEWSCEHECVTFLALIKVQKKPNVKLAEVLNRKRVNPHFKASDRSRLNDPKNTKLHVILIFRKLFKKNVHTNF